MRRLVLIGALAILGVAGACNKAPGPLIARLEAQTLPRPTTFFWVPSPAAQGVTFYRVKIDGGPVQNIAGPSCQAAPECTLSFTLGTLGVHNAEIWASNQWGDGPHTTVPVDIVVPAGVGGGGFR